jgi:hypothetical protein
VRKTDEGIRATVTSVTVIIPAERGSLSIAASSPKNSPALISRSKTSRPETDWILTRTAPLTNEKHVVAGVLIPMRVQPVHATVRREEATQETTPELRHRQPLSAPNNLSIHALREAERGALADLPLRRDALIPRGVAVRCVGVGA